MPKYSILLTVFLVIAWCILDPQRFSACWFMKPTRGLKLCLFCSTPEAVKKSKSSCGHVKPSFDGHNRCMWCRSQLKGDDPCVLGESDCFHCQALTVEQWDQLKNPKHPNKSIWFLFSSIFSIQMVCFLVTVNKRFVLDGTW